MFILFFIIAVMSVAYAIKGGQGKFIFPNWETENPISNKLSSVVCVFVLISFLTTFYQVNIGIGITAWQSVGLFLVGWVLSIAPSLGEEYGSLMGRSDKYAAWMPKIKFLNIPSFAGRFLFDRVSFVSRNIEGKYRVEWIEGHEYGVKKAVQRGVWIGACMTAVTGYVPFIYFSIFFVPLAYFSLNFVPKIIFDPWGWSEIAIGGICYGVPLSLHIYNLI
jgi:hypothetical protein